jgi:uncharacterized iron-regulated protein
MNTTNIIRHCLFAWIGATAFLMPVCEVQAQKAVRKALAESPVAYALFNANGDPLSWPEVVAQASQADVVFFGELHDDPIMHWLQAQLVRDLLDLGLHPALGAEMLEADDQLVVNEFVEGIIQEDKFKAAANLWPNHFTDYHPLLELARDHHLAFVATNIPRRYASHVYKHGLDGLSSLSEEAQTYLPALPIPFDITLPGYEAMLAMGGGHGGETLPMAQAIKDATMAHWIGQHLTDGTPFVHFNGAYHSQHKEGIVWYLTQNHPELTIMTIHGHIQRDVMVPDSAALTMGDVILITHENMTRTH